MGYCTKYLIIKVLVASCLWPFSPAKHDFVWFLDFVWFRAKAIRQTPRQRKLPQICIFRCGRDVDRAYILASISVGTLFHQFACSRFREKVRPVLKSMVRDSQYSDG
jgi:hypothetical protein